MGNPPTKKQSSKVKFSRNAFEEILHEEVPIYRQPNHSGGETIRDRHGVPELCREHGISSATFYKWRAKYGGMDVSLMVKMKELEDENRRLKKLYVDAQMRALIVEETLAKK